jgi:hypothetical protein
VIKFLVRWVFRACILLLVIAVALVLLKDVLAKAWAEYEIHARSGMDVRIGRMELGLFSPTVTLEDLKIFNLPEFGGSPFLDMPDLHLEYDVAALFQRKLHLPLARVAVTEINIVEARDGRTNLVLAVDDLGSQGGLQKATGTSVFGLTFTGIDTLNLSFGKVKYRSLRRPENATDLTIGLKNGIFSNVRSIPELKRLVLNTTFRNGITINQAPARHSRPRLNARESTSAQPAQPR